MVGTINTDSGPNFDAPLRVSEWSTRDIAPAHRFSVWSARPLPSLARLFDSEPIGAFETSVAEVQLGGAALQYAQGTGRHYTRSEQRAVSDAVDLLGICFLQTGSMQGDTDHGPFTVGTGEILLFDFAQTGRLTLGTSTSVQFAVPRALAQQHLGTVSELHGMVISPPAAALAFCQVLTLRRTLPALTERQGPRIARLILESVAIGLGRGDRHEATAPGVSSARRAAEQAIERQLHDSSLDAATLCAQLDISRGALFRLFKLDGGYQAYARGRRLEHVRRALEDRDNHATLAELAETWGFSDASHLNRLFRARFGTSPSVYRKKT